MPWILRVQVSGFAWLVFLLPSVGVTASDGTTPLLVLPPATATCDVAVDLPESFQQDSSGDWRIVPLGAAEQSLPVQLSASVAEDGSAAGRSRLIARIAGDDAGDVPRKFRLVSADAPSEPQKPCFEFKQQSDASLALFDGDQPVMVYNHGEITCDAVPQSDSRRVRACYVHPVWGLDGEVLSDDFPKDHYHHHGIFWAWPHVGIDGQEHDLWTYRTIQQRFVGWIYRQTGPQAAVLAVENGWFVGDEKVMVERVWMRCHRVDNDHRAIDFEFVWIPVEKPITLWGADDKSYGGLNLRFAPRQDTRITVPAGQSEADLPDTPLEWADLTANFAGAPQPSGAAIFVDPAHPDYPPTWLTRHYGVLCVGWPGVHPRTFEPGKPIRLNYRVWIHRGAIEAPAIGRAYEAYKAAMAAKWES